VAVDFPKRVVHGGSGKRQQEITCKNVLDFSASVNPYPPSVDWHVDPTILTLYPDDSYHSLKERIASVFSREPGEICVGNGSIEIIRAFCSVTLSKFRQYHLESPTFGEYDLSARLTGARCTQDPAAADVRFICNPNNPTGVLREKSAILSCLKEGKNHGGLLFCDEAFIGLADPEQSVAGIRDPNLFVLHSLTKTFSVPGLRIGFGFGDPALVEKIETARCPWSVNAYAEAFALQALLHLDDLAQSRTAIAREREHLIAGLGNLGLTCHPSVVNYLLVECGRLAPDLCEALARKKILVRDCTSFGLPTSIRIAVRTRDENSQLLEALASCVR